MTQEERIFKGWLYWPGDPELKAMKLRSHNLSARYNQTLENEVEKRSKLLKQIVGKIGVHYFMQGPIFFHYGSHTEIGDNFFANYNLTIQDDAKVHIGENANFGPNVTIVTPIHPFLPSERFLLQDPDGRPRRMCYAKPVTIGNNVWLCASVTVCGGVTIGNGCVIGAGSVVTRDIPDNSFAAGVPCRLIRKITKNDSMEFHPEILADCGIWKGGKD